MRSLAACTNARLTTQPRRHSLRCVWSRWGGSCCYQKRWLTPTTPPQNLPAQFVEFRRTWILRCKQQCPRQRHLISIERSIHGLEPRLGITSELVHQRLMAAHLRGTGTGELNPSEVTAGGAARPEQQGELLARLDRLDRPADGALNCLGGGGPLAPHGPVAAVDAHLIERTRRQDRRTRQRHQGLSLPLGIELGAWGDHTHRERCKREGLALCAIAACVSRSELSRPAVRAAERRERIGLNGVGSITAQQRSADKRGEGQSHCLQLRSGQRSRPHSRPRKLVTDAAYLARSNRQLLRQRGIRSVVPPSVGVPLTKRPTRSVNQVERLFAQIKQFRRMATRHEKVGVDDLAIVTLGQR